MGLSFIAMKAESLLVFGSYQTHSNLSAAMCRVCFLTPLAHEPGSLNASASVFGNHAPMAMVCVVDIFD